MTNIAGQEFDNEHIEQLLPWYATGKLEAFERLEVETALARSADLRRQLALVQSEIKETINLNQATAMPRADATARFMASIQNTAQRRAAPTSSPFKGRLEWLAQQFAAPPRWAVAAAVLAILLQAALLGALVVEREVNGYHTASGGTEKTADGTLVLARFSDGATLAILNERLAALGITIVDGPKAGGLFTLRIGPKPMPAADRDRKIAALKADAGFAVFVGPVQ